MSWLPSTTAVNWGTFRVTAGPHGGSLTDVSYLRGVPCEVEHLSWADPFGPETATIRFRQVTGFDTPGTGDLSWLARWNELNVEKLAPDGTTTTRKWEGQIAAWDVEHDAKSSSIVLTARGALFQLIDFVRAPAITRSPTTLEAIVAAEYSNAAGVRPSLQTQNLTVTGGPTGISFSTRPAWVRAIDFVRDLLARSAITGGTDQWTVRWVTPRTPNLIKRSAFGTTHTYTFGTPGVTCRLSQDFSNTYNVVYGEGVDTYGGSGRWRNLYINAAGNPYFMPIGYQSEVQGLVEDGAGGLSTNPTTQDSTIQRIEQYIGFGEGFSLDDAKDIAQRYVDRDKDPGWTGEMTLQIDPESGSRYDITAGDYIKLKRLAGTGTTGVTFSVMHAELDMTANPIAMRVQVDTKARDSDTLQKILVRDRSGTAPGRRLQLGRGSYSVADEKVPADGTNGAGWFPRTRAPQFNSGAEGTQTVSCTGGQWTVTEILSPETAMVIATEMFATTTVAFAMAVVDWNVNTANLPVNPLTATDDWSGNVPGLLYAGGMKGQRLGFWHASGASTEVAGAAVSGIHKDYEAWPVSHLRGTAASGGDSANSGQPAKLWVAIFPASTASFHGRLISGIE